MYYLTLLGILVLSATLAYFCIWAGRVTAKHYCKVNSKPFIEVPKSRRLFYFISFTMLLYGEIVFLMFHTGRLL